jgi:hydrogenase 3 maturation protease
MCWKGTLRQSLRELRTCEEKVRIAVLGIGRELYGDDAVGVCIVRELHKLLADHPNLLLLDTGAAPENYCSVVRRFHPHLLILIDAADLGEKPGSTRCVPWQDASGIDISTHSLPLSVFARYMAGEVGCEISLLGIQPADMTFDSSVSYEIQATVKKIVPVLADLLKNRSKCTPKNRRLVDYGL